MKKEIISAVTALTTAFSGMTAMMTTAVDETTAETSSETTASAFLTRISAGVYTPGGKIYGNDGFSRELVPYTGNARFRLVQNDENGNKIKEIGEWYLSEFENNWVTVEFYCMREPDETVYFEWIIDNIDDNMHTVWDRYELEATPSNFKDFASEKLDEEEMQLSVFGFGSEVFLVPSGYVTDVRFGEMMCWWYLRLQGDANLDDSATISDSVAILQYIANADEYPLDDVAKANADVYNPGDGITGKDADSIMKFETGVISSFPETLS